MKRALRPRATSALTIAPVVVSDLTAPVIVGLEARAFRELVARLHVRHVRAGQRVLVRVEDLLSALEREAEAGSTSASAETSEHDGLASADDVLARIGRVRR